MVFPLSVAADDGDTIPHVDIERQVLEKGRAFRVAEGQVFDGHHLPSAIGVIAKGEIEAADGFQAVFFFHFAERLDPRLDHVGQAGLGPEAADEKLDFPSAPFIVLTRLFVNLLVLCHLVVVFGGVALDFAGAAAMNANHVGDDLVHERPVVGDQQQFAGPVLQKTDDPADGGDIQIVGRFIQQQKVRLRNQHFGKIQTHLVSTRKLGRGALLGLGGKPQPGQYPFRLPVLVGLVGRQPRDGFGQNARLGERQVLADVSDTVVAGLDHRTLIGLLLADDQTQKGGLAMSVAAHQTDLFPVVQPKADTVEQLVLAVSLVNMFNTEHRVLCLPDIACKF